MFPVAPCLVALIVAFSSLLNVSLSIVIVFIDRNKSIKENINISIKCVRQLLHSYPGTC